MHQNIDWENDSLYYWSITHKTCHFFQKLLDYRRLQETIHSGRKVRSDRGSWEDRLLGQLRIWGFVDVAKTLWIKFGLVGKYF